MEKGPVNSSTYNHIKQLINDGKDAYIKAASKQRGLDKCTLATCKTNLSRAELDELSDADLEIVDRVWERYGHMSGQELSAETHKNFREWEDPTEEGRKKGITFLSAVFSKPYCRSRRPNVP